MRKSLHYLSAPLQGTEADEEGRDEEHDQETRRGQSVEESRQKRLFLIKVEHLREPARQDGTGQEWDDSHENGEVTVGLEKE